MNISIRFSGTPVESTECADNVANVRVIDVTVNYVGDDVLPGFFLIRISSAAKPMRTKSFDSKSVRTLLEASMRSPPSTLSKIGCMSDIVPMRLIYQNIMAQTKHLKVCTMFGTYWKFPAIESFL